MIATPPPQRPPQPPPQRPPSARPSALGLGFALLLPLAYGLGLGPRWLQPRLDETSYALAGMALLWGCALGVLATVRFHERRPLRSVGFRPLAPRGVLAAVGIGLGLSLLVPLLTLAASQLLPAAPDGGILDAAARTPVWLLALGVLTAAFCEEILFRAYPLERFGAAGRPPWAGALLGLAAFVLLHASGWNLVHLVGVVLPLGVALTLLYGWRRNAWFVIVVHAVVDLPLVVLALLGGPPG